MKCVENSILEENINRIFCKSSENMEELADNSVHLMVTSQPYDVGKEYDRNFYLWANIWSFLMVSGGGEVYRAIVPGGRVCVNIANLRRKPYIHLYVFMIRDMLNIGFLMRD